MGRMSFDMFPPSNLVCSIQGIFNRITLVDAKKDHHTLKSIPRSLKDEIDFSKTEVKSFGTILNIVLICDYNILYFY